MNNPILVCPHCGNPVDRQVIWRKPHEIRVSHTCEQHQSVVPVLKECGHE